MARLLLVLVVAYTIVSLFGYQTAVGMTTETSQASEPTTTSDVITENCSANDPLYDKCLNNGQCQVDIKTDDGSRTSWCLCDNTHYGSTCERKKRPVITGSVTAGIVIAAFVVLIAIVAVIVSYRRKLKEKCCCSSVPEPESTPV